MPIYEYRCKSCHQVFEKWRKSFEESDNIDCPICSGASERIMSHSAFVLKGGGWYATEYGKNKSASVTEAGCESSASGKAEVGESAGVAAPVPASEAGASCSAQGA